ncbi:MAG: dual specificity protein phosphatase family protein [Desulfoferrobacter sp.]
MKRYVIRFRRLIIISLILVVLSSAGYSIFMEEQGNFHQITAGEAYRSGQLDKDELQYYLSKYGIRSVINLRGKNARERWYLQEKEICRDSKVAHYDLALSATNEPSRRKIEELVRLFREVPRPVLIHCQAGADRSGIAAALWKVIVDGLPKSKARNQLSIHFGHIPIGPTGALDDFFEKWKAPMSASKYIQG